jgi:LuxR family maltose regulon positive regulatory protein
MVTTLLSTKWHVPPLRPERVPRAHLIERLNAALQAKLTLVSAPAGFGKTTLISEWAVVCPNPVAWLSLDEADNDPARFLAYLIAALQTLDASIGAAVLPTLQAGRLQPLEQLIAQLINQIDATKHRVVLILDDYHLIKAQEIHEAVAFLLEHLPHNLHLVIATRADPPLPLARLRARAQLKELRQSDLRFTSEEIAAFLNRIMGLGLSPQQVAALAECTEGWVAGLQMAAVSMQGQDKARVASLVQELAGSDRYIMDYLLSEVLERQPSDVQRFLLQTSVLERLSGPLCDAVLGQQDGAQSMLEHLERANLFVLALDSHRQWYRYHRLFADLLRSRLATAQSDLAPQLHQRASIWFEQNGMLPEAIEHAISAQDYVRAADRIAQVAEETVMRSELATFLRWVDRLPTELVVARPSLALAHAWALLMTGRWAEAMNSYLGESDAALAAQKLAPLQALIALFEGRLPDARALALQALQELPEGDGFLRGTATWNLSLTCLAEGDFEGARQALEGLLRMSRGRGNTVLAVMALCSLAIVHRRQGHLQQSRAMFERALELATDQDGHRLPAASEPLMALGELWREWNDLDRATQYLAEGIERAKQWAEASSLDGYMSLARVEQARGDWTAADAAIDNAMRMAEQFDIMEMDDLLVALLQARLLLGRGQTEAARRCIRRWGLDRDLSLDQPTPTSGVQEAFMRSRLRKYQHILLARLRIAEGRPAEALALVEPLLPKLEELQRTDLALEVWILIALAYQALDDEDPAMAALGRALSLAEAGGYVRTFVDEGPPMARLLYQAAQQDIYPQYAGKLLAAYPIAERAAVSAPSMELVEPLSGRELEILELVAKGLTNQQIAEKLFLSLATVKWHTHNIYGKLGVNRRTEAVARARTLGILPTLLASP